MTVDIRKALKKFAPHFIQARDQALNEADTVLRLCKFFEEVLGYDGLQDISRESQMKNKYVDMCIKIDGRVRLLIEAKAANLQLRDRHIEQAQGYAAQNNYSWVVLTNGVDWHLYHLTFDEGIEYERAFTATIGEDAEFDRAAEFISILHKQSIRKGGLEEFWEKTAALDSSSIGKALFNEDVLSGIRREIRRATGLLVDPEDLAKSIHGMLSVEAREKIGPFRIRKRKRSAKKEVEGRAEQQADSTPGPSEDTKTASAGSPCTVTVAEKPLIK